MKIFTLHMLGSSCKFDKIDDLLAEVKEALEQDDEVEIAIFQDQMTEEQYKSLPEFQGW